jgi:hypothetical protein
MTCGTAWPWRCWSSTTTSSGYALLGHRRIDTTQIYASIRPAQLKRVVGFYEEKASRILGG